MVCAETKLTGEEYGTVTGAGMCEPIDLTPALEVLQQECTKNVHDVNKQIASLEAQISILKLKRDKYIREFDRLYK